MCVVHGNLTGANIAPEGGEWALDSGGFVCVCVWFMATLLAPILRRRAVYGGWIRGGFDWLPAWVGKCTVAIAPVPSGQCPLPTPPSSPHP